MRTRRIALVVTLVLGLIGTTTGAALAKRAPEGFRNVNVKEAGFKIAIPDEWEVINLSKGDVDAAFDNLVDEVPEFEEQFPRGISDLVAQNVALFAAIEGDNFNPNLNVIHDEGGSLPSVDELEQQLLTVVDEVEISEVRVDGVDALRAIYRLQLEDTVAQGVQYQVEGDAGLLGFTFTASTEDPLTKTFRKMAKSIDLT